MLPVLISQNNIHRFSVKGLIRTRGSLKILASVTKEGDLCPRNQKKLGSGNERKFHARAVGKLAANQEDDKKAGIRRQASSIGLLLPAKDVES